MNTPETTTDAAADSFLQELREQVSETDRAIVDLLNTRLELVGRISKRKRDLGLAFLDPQREEWMLRDLSRANRGPLSDDGLKEVLRELLALTKREIARGADGS
jgi:chorismate mutase